MSEMAGDCVMGAARKDVDIKLLKVKLLLRQVIVYEAD